MTCLPTSCAFTLVLSLLLAPHLAAAAEPAQETEAPDVTLDPVVVAGTSIPIALSQSSGSVTVITKAEITAMAATTVGDVLQQLPGLHIDHTASRGSVSSVYTRGADPNYTLVLIDGVRVNDPTNSRGGSFDFSTLSVDNIERIEIARGVFSSVYGSEAMAGVINIVTTRGTGKPVITVDLSAGGYGYYRAVIDSHGAMGSADYSLSGSYLDTGEPVEASSLIGKSVNVNLGFSLTDRSKFRYVLRYADSELEAFPDDSGGPEYAVIRQVEERDADELTMGLEWSQELMRLWVMNMTISYDNREEQIDSPGVAPGIRDPFGIPPSMTDNRYHRYDIRVSNLLEPLDVLQLSIGIDAQVEEGKSRGTLLIGGINIPTSYSMQRYLVAAFLEIRYEPVTSLMFQAGIRVDVPEGYASQFSPRLSISYTVAPTTTTLRISWGEGFKLPSFFALGNPIVGNPALMPEQSGNLEVAVTQPFMAKQINVTAAIFFNRYTDLVDFDAGPPPMLVNRSTVTANGVELSATIQAGETLTLLPHVTYVKTSIEGTATELRNRPQWRGGIASLWKPHSTLRINLGLLVVGRVHDSSVPTGPRDLNAYTRMNLVVKWHPNATWQLYVAVDNLTNNYYEEAIGFVVQGIRPRAGIKATF